MPKQEDALATPYVLKWARVAAGYDVTDVATKLKVEPKRVDEWERGERHPALGTLDSLAALYRRPTAFFYLEKPPAAVPRQPADFRDKKAREMSPQLLFQVRHAMERREIALSLLDELGETPAVWKFRCADDELPEDAGVRLRAALEIPIEVQLGWKDSTGYTATRAWKLAAESRGILVFQASRKAMGGTRGLSLHAIPLPVVILNSDDVPVSRPFSLLHELTHLGLRQSGFCDHHNKGIELFCNRVAAAALMPSEALLEQAERLGVRQGSKRDAWKAIVRKLARAFSVSEPALVLRLVAIDVLTWNDYNERHREFILRAEQAKKKQEPPRIPPHVKAISRNGEAYTTLVMAARARGAITLHRAASYLHISHEHIGRVESHLLLRGAPP